MYKIITSNLNKLAEYQRFGLDNLIAITGEDIREVSGTSEEVAIYKSLVAGNNVIVEDSILIVDGIEIVDIKYQLVNLIEKFIGKKAIFKVTLAVQENDKINTYVSELHGNIQDLPKPLGNFGFDYCFIPDRSLKSLYELNTLGLKDNFSPRRNAIHKLLNNQVNHSYLIKDILPWTGSYQS